MNYDEIIKQLLNELNDSIGWYNLLNEDNGSDGSISFLVMKKENLQFRMEQDKNHKRPHFHLTIDKEPHAASICIATGDILAGELQNKYKKVVNIWREKNKDTLHSIWNDLQSGSDGRKFLVDVKA